LLLVPLRVLPSSLPSARMPDGSWRYRRAEIDAWLADGSNRA
jgi:hypothetical protein